VYLGGEDILVYEDNMVYITKKCTSDILLREYDFV
jgi:hypothetical protein